MTEGSQPHIRATSVCRSPSTESIYLHKLLFGQKTGAIPSHAGANHRQPYATFISVSIALSITGRQPEAMFIPFVFGDLEAATVLVLLKGLCNVSRDPILSQE